MKTSVNKAMIESVGKFDPRIADLVEDLLWDRMQKAIQEKRSFEVSGLKNLTHLSSLDLTSGVLTIVSDKESYTLKYKEGRR